VLNPPEITPLAPTDVTPSLMDRALRTSPFYEAIPEHRIIPTFSPSTTPVLDGDSDGRAAAARAASTLDEHRRSRPVIPVPTPGVTVPDTDTTLHREIAREAWCEDRVPGTAPPECD
jgi:hypothetical protein